MHGKQWHDHRGPVEGQPGSRSGTAVMEAVRDSGETVGMGKARPSSRGPKRKRMTPIGKGRKGERATARAGAGRNVKAGMKTPGRRA